MDWDEYYRSSSAFFGDAPEEILVAHRHLLAPARPVLDVGAGQGRNALFLARDGFCVHAIDPSRVAVETLAAEAERAGLEIVVRRARCDAYTPDVESFGGVLGFGILPLLRRAEIDGLTDRVEAWTDEGSHLFLTAFTTLDPAFPRCRDEWTSLGKGSFEGPDGTVRTFLDPGELPALFPSFRPVHHREHLGPAHRHGDGPEHRHALAQAVLAR